MNTTFYLIYSRKKVERICKTGPPNVKAGERFTAISISVPDELWHPQKVEPVRIEVTKQNSVAPPAKVDLTKMADVCFGKILRKQNPDLSNVHDVIYGCTGCDFTQTWNSGDEPHWKFTKAAKK